MTKKCLLVCYIVCLSIYASAQEAKTKHLNSGFKIIPLGVKGGLDESNLSAYLVAAKGTDQYLCLDAGTIYKGLELAVEKKLFIEKDPSVIQQKYINSYFISHAHLDHTAGLIMNSPSDLQKKIYGLPSVLDVFKKHYFTWSAWANFGNEGEAPILKKYSYQNLIEGVELPIENTNLFVTPFVLSHVKPYESSAFLIRNQDKYMLYLGDTGADAVEQSTQLEQLWKTIAPMIDKQKLIGLFIEVSFDNSVPDKSLFGHLTPALFMKEMTKLNSFANGQLNRVPIYITHLKPCTNCETNIKQQIEQGNQLHLNIHYPAQAVTIELH